MTLLPALDCLRYSWGLSGTRLPIDSVHELTRRHDLEISLAAAVSSELTLGPWRKIHQKEQREETW